MNLQTEITFALNAETVNKMTEIDAVVKAKIDVIT